MRKYKCQCYETFRDAIQICLSLDIVSCNRYSIHTLNKVNNKFVV